MPNMNKVYTTCIAHKDDIISMKLQWFLLGAATVVAATTIFTNAAARALERRRLRRNLPEYLFEEDDPECCGFCGHCYGNDPT